jgi:hypothetical protein
MAIKAVRDNFVQMLKSSHGASSALRTHAGNVFKHTMYVKTSDMERLLTTELNRVLKEENKARAAYFSDAMRDSAGGFNVFGDDVKSAMLTGSSGKMNRKIPVHKATIEKEAKAIIAKHLMNPKTYGPDSHITNVKNAYKYYIKMPKLDKGVKIKAGRKIYEIAVGDFVEFDLEIGDINISKKTGGPTVQDEIFQGDAEDRSGKLINIVIKHVLFDVFAEYRNNYVAAVGRALKPGGGKGNVGGTQAGKEGRVANIGFNQFLVAKTHGVTDRSPSYTVSKGGTKETTTIAGLTAAKHEEQMKEMGRRTDLSKFGAKGRSLSNSVTERLSGLLEKEYKLSHFRSGRKDKDGTYELDKSIEVALELAGEQNKMRHFDANGIQEYLEAHEALMVKELQRWYGKHIKDLAGSNSLAQDILICGADSLQNVLTKAGKFDKRKVKTTKSGGLDLRFKENRALVAQVQKAIKSRSEDIRYKVPGKPVKKTKGTRGSSNKVAKPSIRNDRGPDALKTAPQHVTSNPLALADFINKGLPKAIKGNMGVPALVNRTGRFAESAEVKNITMGPRGGTVAEYTYQKNPYQVFEPGNAMGSTYRDPRKIIGESVRQIAQSIMRDRFIRTRRI